MNSQERILSAVKVVSIRDRNTLEIPELLKIKGIKTKLHSSFIHALVKLQNTLTNVANNCYTKNITQISKFVLPGIVSRSSSFSA